MGFAIVFLGAGIGGALRHGVNLAAVRYLGFGFPFGTLIVNILGSFLMGLLAGYFAYRTGIPQHMRLFLTTGILGALQLFLRLASMPLCLSSDMLMGMRQPMSRPPSFSAWPPCSQAS
nr:CrcB family protein [Sphingomonas sediminicola]